MTTWKWHGLAGVPNLALYPLELPYTFACSCIQIDDQSQIRNSSSPQPRGHAGMLCEVNTWSPRCCTVEEANAPRCTVRTRKGMALYMPAGIYISCCRKMAILQTTVPLFKRHIMHPAFLLQCVNTELQPVVT